jgi:predicted phosphodiesterase
MSTVLAIPDMHFGQDSHHQDLFDFLTAVKKKFRPDVVVCLGDEIEAASLGDWEKDPDGMSAGAELDAAILHLKRLYKIFPEVKVCTSNHTSRIYRRAFKSGMPKKLIKSYSEILEAPSGWVWKDYWEVDKIIYEHGEGFSGQAGALKAAQANMQSTVIGHLHSYAGIQYYANNRHLIFGFNVGCLINHHSPVFNYAKHIKAKPIIGCGIIENGIPRFIPMQLSSRGRWIGTL